MLSEFDKLQMEKQILLEQFADENRAPLGRRQARRKVMKGSKKPKFQLGSYRR